jgi:hypothetical protein
MKCATLERHQPLGNELMTAIDQTGCLCAIHQGTSWNIFVIGFIGLTKVRCVGVGNSTLCAHPVNSCTRVKATRESDTDLFTDRQVL